MNEEYIILNEMFTGSFNVNNIGREIINNFKTDFDEEYIYILPYGGISKKMNNKVKYIINIGPVQNNSFEILSLVEFPEQLYFGGNLGNEKAHNEQINYIKEHNIIYGGKPLNEIMKGTCVDNGSLYYTFKAKKVIRPARRLYVIQDENEEISIDRLNCAHLNINIQRFIKRISSKKDTNLYKDIVEKIINNKSLWDEKDITTKIDMKKFEQNVNSKNFLKVIDKEDEETIFTNMIYYFLNNNMKLANSFVESILKINGSIENIFKEKSFLDYMNKQEKSNTKIRNIEKRHTHLWIETDKNIIVIENKIWPGINGIYKDSRNLQLDSYYEYAEWYKCTHAPNKECKYFIFTPNYNNELIMKSILKFKHGIEYDVINYKQLYDFFNSVESRKICKDEYYNEFVNVLFKHIFKKEEELERRFALKIIEK